MESYGVEFFFFVDNSRMFDVDFFETVEGREMRRPMRNSRHFPISCNAGIAVVRVLLVVLTLDFRWQYK